MCGCHSMQAHSLPLPLTGVRGVHSPAPNTIVGAPCTTASSASHDGTAVHGATGHIRPVNNARCAAAAAEAAHATTPTILPSSKPYRRAAHFANYADEEEEEDEQGGNIHVGGANVSPGAHMSSAQYTGAHLGGGIHPFASLLR